MKLFVFPTILFFVSTSECTKINCRYRQRTGYLTNTTFENIEMKAMPRKVNSGRTCSSYLSQKAFSKSDMDQMMDCSTLDLSHNAIDTLDENIFEHNSNLESLNLDNNQLTVLPENIFDGLVNLEILSIKWNLLESLPEDLFKFNKKLVSLDLSHNKISKIHPAILDDLPKLSFVSFRDNICVNSTFPDECLEDLKFKIEAKCGEANLKTVVLKIFEMWSQVHDEKNSSDYDSAEIEITSTTTSKREVTESTILAATTSRPVSDDLQILLTSLFWLIIPITLILFIILALIFYAIYNKYLVYHLRIERR